MWYIFLSEYMVVVFCLDNEICLHIEWILTVEWASLFLRDMKIYCRNIGLVASYLSCGHHCLCQQESVDADISHLEFYIFILSAQWIMCWSWGATRTVYVDLWLASSLYFQSSLCYRTKNRKIHQFIIFFTAVTADGTCVDLCSTAISFKNWAPKRQYPSCLDAFWFCTFLRKWNQVSRWISFL